MQQPLPPVLETREALYDYVWRSPPLTLELARSPLFRRAPHSQNIEEQTKITYDRARAACLVYGLTIEDVLELSPKFWRLQTDLLGTVDGGALTLINIQYNLFVGTVAPYASTRPELRSILQSAMQFDVSAQFMLTEVGHGLDARNLETTATLQPNGDFELHTPSPAAAKCMPPSSPRSGIPVIAVVIARLIIGETDHGVRPFLVSVGDGKEMCKGVVCKVLPPRTGAHPIDHALTYFDRVRLPSSALLGCLDGLPSKREQFDSTISRVAAGTLFLSSPCISVLKMAVFNASRFSMRRLVQGHERTPVPVMSFRTQHLPILHAIAQYHVLQAYLIDAGTAFKNPKTDPRVRHGIATIFKAVCMHHFRASTQALNDGCGWHGYFEHNQILQVELEFRAVGTAEGDVRVLAIRLASELLLGRYEMPPPQDPENHVARHEASLFAEARELLLNYGGKHRVEQFNRDILPLSLPLVVALGHRMAVEAAREAKVDPKIIALYESGVMKGDPAWYAEQGGVSRKAQREMEAQAADALLPSLPDLVQQTGMEPYANAPMSSQPLWDGLVAELDTYSGEATFDIYEGGAEGRAGGQLERRHSDGSNYRAQL